MTLDEVITEYGLTRKIKDPKWRTANQNFPYHQPTGNRGSVTVWRSELEKYLTTKP